MLGTLLLTLYLYIPTPTPTTSGYSVDIGDIITYYCMKLFAAKTKSSLKCL